MDSDGQWIMSKLFFIFNDVNQILKLIEKNYNIF